MRDQRRNKILVLIAVIVFVIAGGCSRKDQPGRFEAEFLELFDTVTQITGYAPSKEIFTQQVQSIHDELKEYHELYDIYDSYDSLNNLKTINDNAGIAPVKVDKRIIDLLLLGREMYERSEGTINIAYGSVLSIWHDYRTEGINNPDTASLPPVNQLKEASLHTDINQMLIDEEAGTVYLKDPKMRLDVGSIGKGYAVEQAARYAADQGYSPLLLSVGGNIRAVGRKPNGQLWKVGIQNPDTQSDENFLFKAALEDVSLVTSGNYQRFYTVDGKRYHHIIDPATLMPSAYYAAVSIICPDSGMADALSTAVFNMPLEQGMTLIESLPDTEAMWVYEDGTIEFSSGFEAYLIQ